MNRVNPHHVIFCTAVILLATLIGPVSGTTYINDTLNLSNPVQFQDQINMLNSGDILALRPGTYHAYDISFPVSITIESYGGTAQNTIIDGTGSTSGILYNDTLHPSVTTAITLINLTLSNGYSSKPFGGGAVSDYGDINVISSNFINDTSPVRLGGALSIDHFDANITVSGSTFMNCSAAEGGSIYNSGEFVFVNSSSFISSEGTSAGGGGAVFGLEGVNATFCQFSNIISADGVYIESPNGYINAPDNWWGTNSPSASLVQGSGPVTYTPYLLMGITATPVSLTAGLTSAIQVNFTYDSDSNQPSPNQLPDGIPIFFTIGSGTGTIPSGPVLTANHLAGATFTSSSAGSTMVNASAYGYNISTLISVSPPAPINNGSGNSRTCYWCNSGTSGADYSGVQPTLLGDETLVPTQTPTPTVTPSPVITPVITPVPLPTTQPSAEFPAVTIFLILVCIVIIVIVAYLIFRWRIQRQNPALFKKLK